MHELARLRELITRHAGTGLTPTALPGVSVLRATAATEPLGDVAEPAVAVIAQGVKQTALNGHVFTYGPGQFLIVPVELPLVGHIAQASPSEPLLAFVLRLRRRKSPRCWPRRPRVPLPPGPGERVLRGPRPAPPGWVSARPPRRCST